MWKSGLLAVASIALIAAAPGAAQARSIKNQLSNQQLASYCATVPVNSETNASLTLPNGSTVTGSVHCEAEDLAGSNHDLNDDHGGDRPDGVSDDGPGDDNGGSHHSSDDGPDDNGHHSGDGDHNGSGHGSDDHGDDDHGQNSGHGGGDDDDHGSDDHGGHGGDDDHGSDHD